jgi:thioredoxin 1
LKNVSEVSEEMSGEHERFISEEDEELRRIKEKKLKELMRLKEKKQEMNPKPIPVTDSNFSEMVNKHPLALIDCWAPWCGPCVVISPIVEELAKEYAGKAFFGKLNVDENPRTAGYFQIFGIPTLLIIKNGKEVDRIVGLVPKDHIEARLKKQVE